jgi:CheY-like chemotaxis protein
MPRILYVDDEADLREIAQMSLELDPEFEVRVCPSGTDALAEVEHWHPDLILLDVMMPGLDGKGVLAKLRESPKTASIPVVFITARKRDSDVAALQELGAKAVLGKPFDPMRLAEQVREFLH